MDGRRPKSETIPLSGRTCWQSRHLRAGSPGAFIAIGPSCRFACPEGRCICRLPFVRRRECSMSPAGDRAARARLTAYASDVRVGGAGLLPGRLSPWLSGVSSTQHISLSLGVTVLGRLGCRVTSPSPGRPAACAIRSCCAIVQAATMRSASALTSSQIRKPFLRLRYWLIALLPSTSSTAST